MIQVAVGIYLFSSVTLVGALVYEQVRQGHN